jgi:hypothetical protein
LLISISSSDCSEWSETLLNLPNLQPPQPSFAVLWTITLQMD